MLLNAIIWAPGTVVAAFFTYREISLHYPGAGRHAFVSAAILSIAIYIILKILINIANYRGRRLLLASILRKWKWEFWPIWLFYIPAGVYILYLGIKKGGLLLFTAANPAIPGSGIAGESKSRILSSFHESAYLARHILISSELSCDQKIVRIEQFMTDCNLEFPLILKPDAGERGKNVLIVRDFSEAKKYIQRERFDFLAQEYIPGREFGIFYYRIPGENRGKIFSITDKRLLSLTGDGCSTVEELILKDPRAFLMAPTHFRQNAKRLDFVPGSGESYPLVEYGNHCRGSLFLDGGRLITDELEKKIDEITREYEGFYFGRYDVRSPSEEELKRGNFKIIELNGVTSEATNLYDPKNSLFAAYRILFRQWNIAFEIGRRNIEAGARPLTFGQFFRIVFLD